MYTTGSRVYLFQRIASPRSHSLSSSPFSISFLACRQHTASPKWVLKPEPRNLVLRGRRVIIDCQAEGIPPPIHQWKKRLSEGQSGQTSSGLPNEFTAIVSGPRLHVLENGSLAIVDANKSDEGEFVCEA